MLKRYDAWDFENWLRYTVPWQLNLSPSKQVAMEMIFGGFRNYAVRLEGKAPGEFDQFFKALQTRLEKVSKWKAPRGAKVVGASHKGRLERWPNGKPRYVLVEKWQIDQARARLRAFRDKDNEPNSGVF